jgi:hypothetical protein
MTNIAYTHPTPRHQRGARHETVVHTLANRAGDLVQTGCGMLKTLYEAPHTPDGVRLTDAPSTCPACRKAATR